MRPVVFPIPARLSKVEDLLSDLLGQPSRLRVEWIDENPTTPLRAKSTTAV